jgi:hypothetical protein
MTLMGWWRFMGICLRIDGLRGALVALRGQGTEGNEPGSRRHRTLAPPSVRRFDAVRATFAPWTA